LHETEKSRTGSFTIYRKEPVFTVQAVFPCQPGDVQMDQRFTIAEAARSLEIRANMLGRWIKESEADNNSQTFQGNGKLSSKSTVKVMGGKTRKNHEVANKLNRPS